ncbi:hypothetical protein DIJ64_13955 [Mycobacterium leprae]|uniref:Uncharacterized protein n=1 Tax=Mycobacterium leprae TaxID=1769 RepID=A0AAD0KTN3_MYCLR|nr:hypothetical protein DIJ64_13955 [Mycobacterium leprae]OAR20467.1 hypothetical protein A8144_02260 [Mycobacterium leprae 3125609]OAX72072.1 hypothetical protein A3216_02535 [Mycobacterium leprae 7935681]
MWLWRCTLAIDTQVEPAWGALTALCFPLACRGGSAASAIALGSAVVHLMGFVSTMPRDDDQVATILATLAGGWIRRPAGRYRDGALHMAG